MSFSALVAECATAISRGARGLHSYSATVTDSRSYIQCGQLLSTFVGSSPIETLSTQEQLESYTAAQPTGFVLLPQVSCCTAVSTVYTIYLHLAGALRLTLWIARPQTLWPRPSRAWRQCDKLTCTSQSLRYFIGFVCIAVCLCVPRCVCASVSVVAVSHLIVSAAGSFRWDRR